MSKPTIIIHIEGGIVQGVACTTDADVVVVDTDIEGSDRIKTCPADLPWYAAEDEEADIYKQTGDLVSEDVAAKFKKTASVRLCAQIPNAY